MDQQNLLVKNTFIDISSGNDDESLPRAFSDQSHARNQTRSPVPVLTSSISPIAEEGSESDRGQEFQDNKELESFRTISRPDEGYANYSIPSLFSFLPVPLVASQPQIDDCRWHEQSTTMGELSEGGKVFTKLEFDGRLSMLTNDVVFEKGVHRFLVLIESGSLSVADGFGFVFSSSLPCKKNIQKIESIFVSKKGKICSRLHNELETLNDRSIGTIEVGSVVELVVDLDALVASFNLYSPPSTIDAQTLAILVRDEQTLSHWQVGTWKVSLEKIVEKTQKIGHFCAVLKNKFTKLRFL